MAIGIQDPTVGIALQELFSLQGRVRPQLEEFIIPTVQIADLSEFARPPVRRAVATTFNINGVAGEFSTFRIEVPGNGLLHIRKLNLVSLAAGTLLAFFGSSLGVPINTASKSFTDGRLLRLGNQVPAGVLTFGTDAAALAVSHWRHNLNTDTSTIIPNGWVAGTGRPGEFGFIEFQFATVNVRVHGSVEWDEYSIL